MDELRFKKLEISVNHLTRRADDCEADRAGQRRDIDMLQKIFAEQQKANLLNKEGNELISEGVTYIKKFYEVFSPLAKVSGFVIKVGTASLLIWHGIKLIAAKFAFLT